MEAKKIFVYENIIGLQEHFHPVYLLDNEYPGQWKQFIPNEKFYELLTKVIDALNGEIPKKSFWILGTYGVGKSHVTSVVKHLLWDDIKDIEDYINTLEDVSLRVKLKNFRSKNKVVPIVIKGVSDITNNQTFKFVIQKNIKEQLKKTGINLNVDSEFDTWIKQISEGIINLEKILTHPNISVYVDSKDDLLSKLGKKDIKILETLEEVANEYGISTFSKDIGDWIKDVYNFIKENNYATHLIIYWDEFTSVLELENSNPILNELQKIAELSENHDIYLYLISHRTPSQSKIKKEDYEHVLDRFYEINYTMNSITSYHLIRSAIKIKDEEKFQELLNKYITYDVEKVINTIISHIDNPQIEKELKGIFPIHPYTGYILNFIARNIGSADRSIFTFLNDKEKGFKRFIHEHPNGKEDIFLTADYLWDYFEDQFEKLEENEKIRNVLTVYYSNKEKLENKGYKYLAVFKTILLLNILKTYGKDIKLLSPTVENIKNIYAGVIKEDEIEGILSYIDKERIIYKSPENEFIIQLSVPLDSEELEKIKESFLKTYNNSKLLTKIVEFKIPLRDKIRSQLRKRLFKLVTESSDVRESELRNQLDKLKTETPYELKILYFPIFKTEEEIPLRDLLFRISKEYTDFIYIVGKTPFEENEYEKFIQYFALSKLNDKHKNYAESQKNREFAEKILLSWLENHKVNSYIIFREKELSCNEENLKEIEKKIFKYGLENTSVENENLWKKKTPSKLIETVLFSENLEDFIAKIGKSAKDRQLLELFKIEQDYFVDNEFKSIKDLYKNNAHPVIKIYEDFNEKIKNEKEDFDLDKIIKKYKNIPFGYFPNEIHATVLSFILRSLIGKLYTLEGKLLKKEDFRDFLIYSLKRWDYENEFRVTFEVFSEYREKLAEVLSYIFSTEKSESLETAIKQIFQKIKKQNMYLFLLKDSLEDNLKYQIDIIIKVLRNSIEGLSPKAMKEYSLNLEASKEVLKEKIQTKDWEKLLEQVIDKELGLILSNKNCNLSEIDKNGIIEIIYQEIGKIDPLDVNIHEIRHSIEILIDFKCRDLKTKEPSSIPQGPSVGGREYKPKTEGNLTEIDINSLIDSYTGNIKEILKELVNNYPEVEDWLKNRLKSEI